MSQPRLEEAMAPAFSPGQMVANRYRIVRFVAKGGMGEVYEAEDEELNERVALKTIGAQAAGDQMAIARFKREINLARKVTHPNVCRIFDVGRHCPIGATEEEVTFLTMEFLRGPTLAQRIRDQGALTLDETQTIVSQMSEALAAAHRAGVIHRDFKSDNVMLVSSQEGLRAVVTDFGIARGTVASSDATANLTTDGDIVGTPSYMAPEQVEGGEITAATDIYSLGIVIYEMITGTVPFLGDTALATAVKRLTEPAPSPRLHVPDLDPKWDEAILRCLERAPENRFASPAELMAWLNGPRRPLSPKSDTVAAPAPALTETGERVLASKPARAGNQPFRLTLAILLVVGVAVVLTLRILSSLEEEDPLALSGLPSGPIQARRSVAILGFKNVAGKPEAAWLSTGLAEMFSTELGAGGQLRVIPGENVARMKIELALAEADSLAEDTLQKIRDNVGTDYVVLGSYTALSGGNLRFDLRLQDAASGETVASVAENATEEKLFEMVTRAGERLRNELKLGTPDTSLAASPLPKDSRAASLYAQGLEKLRLFDPLAARQLLEEAATLAPQNPLVSSALASALSALGYQEQAVAMAKSAFELSAHLPEEERLVVEGQYREAAQRWDLAGRIYQTLWNAFPDNLEYGLRLAAVQTASGRGERALVTVETLRRLPPPASEDPRIDSAEAAAAVSLSLFPRQRLAAARGAQKAEKLGAVLLVAQAKITEAEALRHLGRPEDARKACEEARGIYAETENLTGQALALAEVGNILFADGQYGQAMEKYQESLAVYTEIGDQSGRLRALNNIAVVLRNQGHLGEAKERYQEVLDVAQEVSSQMAEASALNNLGAVLFSEGQLEAAKGQFERSLGIHRDVGHKGGEADALGNLGVVLRGLGSLEEAESLLRESLGIRRDIGQKTGEIASLKHLGNVLLDGGDLDGASRVFGQALELARAISSQRLTADALYASAQISLAKGRLGRARQQHEEAAAIRRQLGEKQALTESQLALAFLALEEDRPQQAESLVRSLVELPGPPPSGDHAALSHAAMASSQLAQNRLGEAQREADRAITLIGETENVGIRLEVRIHHARTRAAAGDRKAALESLQETLAEATALGLVHLELETRFALGQIEAEMGRVTQARSRLDSLRQDALDKGYDRMALKASEAAP